MEASKMVHRYVLEVDGFCIYFINWGVKLLVFYCNPNDHT